MYQKYVDCFPCTASLLCMITSKVPLPAAFTGLRHKVKNHKARTTRLLVLILLVSTLFEPILVIGFFTKRDAIPNFFTKRDAIPIFFTKRDAKPGCSVG